MPTFRKFNAALVLLGVAGWLLLFTPALAVFDYLPDDLRPLAQAAECAEPGAAWRLVEVLVDRGLGGSAMHWSRLGAGQGDCRCIREMREFANLANGSVEARDRWNALALRYHCVEAGD